MGASASRRRSHRWASVERASVEWSSAKVGPATLSHSFASLLSSDDVEAIDDVEHGIRVDAVVLGVGARHGSKGTAQGALLVQ